MVDELTSCQARLAGQGGEWGLHRLDTAVFSYYVLRWVHNLNICSGESDIQIKLIESYHI